MPMPCVTTLWSMVKTANMIGCHSCDIYGKDKWILQMKFRLIFSSMRSADFWWNKRKIILGGPNIQINTLKWATAPFLRLEWFSSWSWKGHMAQNCGWHLWAKSHPSQNQLENSHLNLTVLRRYILSTTWINVEANSSLMKLIDVKAAWQRSWMQPCETLTRGLS